MIFRTSQSIHYEQSSYRGMLIEYLFVGELLRTLWPRRVEVMKPQVDDAGYDLVMEFQGIARHIQIKSSKENATTQRQKIHQSLEKKPSGCIIWVWFDDRDFSLGPFLWFGNPPGEPLDLSEFETAHHTKGGSPGNKSGRPAIPKGKFEELESIAEVAMKLFGIEESSIKKSHRIL